LPATYGLKSSDVTHGVDELSDRVSLLQHRNAAIYVRETPVNWGCSGR
jgi:hypothetical protein